MKTSVRALRPCSVRLLPALAVAGLLAGCGLPRDPGHTLNRVQGGTMRVGVVENPPWVRRAGADASGVEAELIREFGRQQGARIQWVWGTESENMKALQAGSLDLAAGGLTSDTPWGNQIGLTRPFYTERVAVGVPPSLPPLRDLTRQRVAVERGSPFVRLIQKKHAAAVQIPDLTEQKTPPAGLPVAAPRWRLEQWGMAVTGTELEKEEHVLAVPPGENGWLMRWEQFLQEQRPQVRAMLKREAAR